MSEECVLFSDKSISIVLMVGSIVKTCLIVTLVILKWSQ
jgi:hypothetical protein